MNSPQVLPPYVREGVKETLQRQQVALDVAIERGNVGMQCAISKRMGALENALERGEGGAS